MILVDNKNIYNETRLGFNNIAIIGAGGFAREVATYVQSDRGFLTHFADIIHYVEDEHFIVTDDKNFKSLSELNTENTIVIIAIGDPTTRKRIIQSLPYDTTYFTFIHDSAVINLRTNTIGKGSIICPNCVVTCNVYLGVHSHLNLNTTIGHDTYTEGYFTTAPGVHVSGNNSIGECVYMGTNSCTKEKLTICSKTVIGLNAGVVKDILNPGTYVGTPAKMKI